MPCGYVAALQVDPIEKKPFFHALPGRRGALLRHARLRLPLRLLPELGHVAGAARPDADRAGRRGDARGASCARRSERGARIVTSTYNEPLITSEWAVERLPAGEGGGARLLATSRTATARRRCSTTCGPGSTLYKVDLKGFRDRPYRELGGTLERVLWTIRALHEKGFWVEVVTLVVPGFNDSPEELRDIARFLASVSPRHPLARDGVPPRLQDGRPRRDGACARCCARPRSARGGAALRLRRQPARRRAQLGEHVLPRLRGAARGAPGFRVPRNGSAPTAAAPSAGARSPASGRDADPPGPTLAETRTASHPSGRGPRRVGPLSAAAPELADLRERVAQRALVVLVLHLVLQILARGVGPGAWYGGCFSIASTLGSAGRAPRRRASRAPACTRCARRSSGRSASAAPGRTPRRRPPAPRPPAAPRAVGRVPGAERGWPPRAAGSPSSGLLLRLSPLLLLLLGHRLTRGDRLLDACRSWSLSASTLRPAAAAFSRMPRSASWRLKK